LENQPPPRFLHPCSTDKESQHIVYAEDEGGHMWRKLIACAAESWYIYLVGCRSSHEASNERLHPIGAWNVWPADHRGGPLFLSLRNRKPARGLRNRGKPKGQAMIIFPPC
jgi:hypothetical protein